MQAWIDRFARWLPEQRPLSVFVHSNPLEALEPVHFHAACEAATRIRQASTTLSRSTYHQLLADRRIRPEDVASARTRLDGLGLGRIDELPTPPPGTILLSNVRPEMAAEVGEMVDGFLLRVLPAFLDLGSAQWPMPGRERGLLATMRWLARTPLGVPEPWLSGLRRRLGPDASAQALIVGCLRERGDPETGWPSILHEALFALPGYAGMIHRLEHVAAERPPEVAVSLLEYLAVRLVVEELALVDVARDLFGRKATLAELGRSLASRHREPRPPRWTPELGAFQDAYEEEYLRSLVGGIAMAQRVERPAPSPVRVQLVACIDDRCESLRRHAEEHVAGCVTFGAAGFFGVALKHRAPLDVDEAFSCPAPITPTKRVSEQLDPRAEAALRRRRTAERLLGAVVGDDASRAPLRGLLASFGNFLRAPATLAQMLLPRLFAEATRVPPGTTLRYDRADEPEGFTLDDQIAVVEGNLRNLGLATGLARWVLILGHGSSSVNNQFASGYQCGACGGRRGGINARVFCAFANDPRVRAGLAARGLEVPSDTIFMPGEHDTALDRIQWLELELLAPERREELLAIDDRLRVALDHDAKERARRFADVPLDEPIARAATRVRARCADHAETRPEYNHATNASCIIGRRALTRGLFLDRRSFLVSYDPTTDGPEHEILERLLAAPLPVCAGINLEYFFSTMDPERFGCGTKLPHNVVGLLGVANGAEGDLRPGLWRQTTEIHDPIRLVTLVEAEPEAIARVLQRLPAVRHLVVNAWIHLLACSPSGRGFFRWEGEGFTPHAALPHVLLEVGSSLEACGHTRANVAPCLVVDPRPASQLEVAW
ncbi:MAG: DUF2309 family protein [Myxococcales bacterium]|nr:DUF2309 family protein [Myxococcales bacterium]